MTGSNFMSGMRYIAVGQTGVHASVLALGAMTFGEKNTWNLSGLNQEMVTQMVSRAIDAGINFFDTADVYDEGESEQLLGQALKPYRDQVLIATKARGRVGKGINEEGLSRHHVRIAIRNSLERLDTKWVDFYQFHGWDMHVPVDESIETMQDLVADGVVNYPGISNFTAWQMATVQARCEGRGYSRYQTAQMNYNLLDRDIEHEILPFLQFSKMTLLVWSPLHGGMLSGKYARGVDAPAGSRMGDRGFYFPPFDEEQGFAIIDAVKQIANEQGVTPAQIALAWLLQKPLIVLLGARTMEQFEENLGALDIKLTPLQLETLDEISKPRVQYPEWMILRQNVQNTGRTFPIVDKK